MTENLAKILVYDDSILRMFESFKTNVSAWRRVADHPHRFGLRQTAKQLSSFCNLMFYATKSFGNYILNKQSILPNTDFPLYKVTENGSRVNISGLMPDYSRSSLYFVIDNESYLRYFQGTIHFGDFVRRYGFECLISMRSIPVNYLWSVTMNLLDGSLFILLDLVATCEVHVEVKTGTNVLTDQKAPEGRGCIIFYLAEFVPIEQSVTLSLRGSAVIREIIMGVLP